MKNESRIATQKEINAVAKRITSKTKSFGQSKADSYAVSAKARINAWAKARKGI